MFNYSGRFTRRQILAASAGLGLTGLLLRAGVRSAQSSSRPPLVWVWQFSIDDGPEALAARLSRHGLGILMKTHDGVDWMSQYDHTPEAIDGPAQVAAIARYFEERGVPFHAWCVVTGTDPWTEAHMASQVLRAGARSLYLDVEPHPGFWQATPQDAQAYASQLRSLAPHDEIVLSIDPRPWMLSDTPIGEFAPYVNALAPQQYWTTFSSEANRERFESSGFPVPSVGPTPEFLLNISNHLLAPFGLPIAHIGPGDSQSTGDWQRFMAAAGGEVSLWRYGITSDSILSTLSAHRASPAGAQALSGPAHIVAPGDTLSAIADTYGLSTADLKEHNALENEDYIYIGQHLTLPQVSGGRVAGFSVHIVQPGDTLSSVAASYGTTTDDLTDLNALANPDALVPGQRLRLP